MSAVETWITRNTHWFRRGMKVDHKWGIVRIEEIAVPVGADGRGPQLSYTNAHMLSARFTTHLHRMIGSSSSASWQAKFVASAFAFVIQDSALCAAVAARMLSRRVFRRRAP